MTGAAPDTVRNNLKHLPELDTTGFRKCQEIAIKNLDTSFAENRPKALVQMATGDGGIIVPSQAKTA